jgi:hypothetical protein
MPGSRIQVEISARGTKLSISIVCMLAVSMTSSSSSFVGEEELHFALMY